MNSTKDCAALIRQKDYPAALACIERVLAAVPGDATALSMKGAVLQRMGRPDEALQQYDRAIARDAVLVDAHYNRATVLAELDRLEEALASYDRAIWLRPNFGPAHANRATLLDELGRHELAIPSHDRAIALKPDIGQLQFNKATSHLSLGQFAPGWRFYEARLSSLVPVILPALDRPLWRGQESLQGKTLLLYAEQGLGDLIQFCRYAMLTADRGAHVVLAVPDKMRRLLAGLHPNVKTVSAAAPLPPCDFHSLLLSLPLAFGTDAGNIPAPVPYLRAEEGLARAWADKIGRHGFRIGIAWQGDPVSFSDAGRSIPLRHFAGLAAIAGVRLISLQKGDGVEQLDNLPPGMKVETLGGDCDSGPDAFIDSAAVMDGLDLVITSDTSIAHLAGALGRPVWVALKHAPDWRWFRGRGDSPWYPTMRLFRQARRGDWTDLFSRIADALRQHLPTDNPP